MKRHLRSLEGRQVTVTFRDGTHMDDWNLVCGARARSERLWLCRDDEDVIVPMWDVVDVSAAGSPPPQAA
jgi:hypothetical protein